MNIASQTVPRDVRNDLDRFVRTIENFPKAGVSFKDITPLLADPDAFRDLTAQLAYAVKLSGAEKVVGLESRGFIFGIAVAQALSLPFVPARKAGKLPGETISVSYALEYGRQALELQRDSIRPGERIAIVDDVLATGGTACAAAELIKKLGGIVSGFVFAIELTNLGGRNQLKDTPVDAALKY